MRPRPRAHRVIFVTRGYAKRMIVIGLICLILGFVFGIAILWTIGIILLVIGLILWVLGAAGHAVGPRAHYG